MVFLIAPASAATAGWRRTLERAGIAVSEYQSPGPAATDRALALVSVVDRTDRDRIVTLKREHPDWPVLAIVSAGSSVRADALDSGADACLAHDAEPVEIVAAVRALERRCQATDGRALKEQEQQIKQFGSDFLSTLSQELRGSLNTILGWTQILTGPMVDSPMMRRGLEAIERSAQAEARVLNDVLDVSRGLTGKLHIDMEPMDLGPALEAALDSIRPVAAAKQIDVIYMPLKEPVRLVGDAARVQQIFWNLLSNAVKFTPLKGRIGVEASATPTSVEVRVVDSGMGIAPDVLPHIFDRSHEGDTGGLFLGLTIVRHLIDVHAGTISASSAGEGQGSVFTVTLPLEAAAGAPPAPVQTV